MAQKGGCSQRRFALGLITARSVRSGLVGALLEEIVAILVVLDRDYRSEAK